MAGLPLTKVELRRPTARGICSPNAASSFSLQTLFDLLRMPETLSDRDLEVLSSFGVKGALVPVGATPEAAQIAEREISRMRRGGIAPFVSFGLSGALLPGGALEVELQRLPSLLSLPRAVALGPLGLCAAEPATDYAVERMLDLAAELKRPVVVRSDASAAGREARRLLSMIRASRIPPERVLGVSLPAQTLVLFRECGHSVGVGLSPAMSSRRLIETVRRFGSERFLLLGEGGDFLGLPKALAILEEAKLPASVIRRVAFENALRFFGIEEL
jgi:predicted metal-dependent TIM-barrel fold hydrolase